MARSFLFVFWFSFLSFLSPAQNLISNAGFEEYTSCPGSYSQTKTEFRVKGWWGATLGTPDHFHSCSQGEAGVPHNWAGVSDAYEGSGFTGIYVWMDNEVNYREYLQSKLTEPLLKDSLYTISFRFKLSSYSRYSIDRIGLLLSDTLIQYPHDRVIQELPTCSFIQDAALTKNTGYWELAKFTHKAKGGEQYVTLGNFYDNEATKYYRIQFTPDQQEMLRMSSYYYIDDVKIIPQFPHLEEMLLPEFSPETIELSTRYVLKNIQFEFNSYKLRPSSFEELEQVVRWMNKHPDITVTLSGHTDDAGGERYNLVLSENRAKSVAAYLKYQGISASRIKTFGYGESRPLIENTNEKSRDENRRVEVIFESFVNSH